MLVVLVDVGLRTLLRLRLRLRLRHWLLLNILGVLRSSLIATLVTIWTLSVVVVRSVSHFSLLLALNCLLALLRDLSKEL